MDKNWYAVYVNSRHEKKVADQLQSQHIENYLPLQRVLKQWSDRRKMVEEPLFRSYVFVNIEEIEKTKVRETKGVINFVYWLGKPAIIRAEEIVEIKNFIATYENITLESQNFQINGTIKLESGPFINQSGKVMSIDKNKVKIFIESLGCYLIADITKNKVLNLPLK
jgi:transcription antitermination factor NusG